MGVGPACRTSCLLAFPSGSYIPHAWNSSLYTISLPPGMFNMGACELIMIHWLWGKKDGKVIVNLFQYTVLQETSFEQREHVLFKYFHFVIFVKHFSKLTNWNSGDPNGAGNIKLGIISILVAMKH